MQLKHCRGGDVSREGVQRDLLPLIEGTTVTTKYGAGKTDHVLFIASGAFHVSKPSDSLPELQGPLPIRVELAPLNEHDFRRILTETEASLIKQYEALMATEGVRLSFTPDAVRALARIAVQVNSSVENIGARRLQTVMERVLDEASFTASDRAGEEIAIDAAFVERNLGDLAKNADLNRFILEREGGEATSGVRPPVASPRYFTGVAMNALIAFPVISKPTTSPRSLMASASVVDAPGTANVE